MATNIMASTSQFSEQPIRQLVRVTSDGPLLLGTCRALLVGTAGTATLTMQDGPPVEDVPLHQGYHPLVVKSITLGTASDVWAGY